MFKVNIATGAGLDRHHEIRARQCEQTAQDLEKVTEEKDGTIDLERVRTNRSIGQMFRDLTKRFRGENV